MLKVVTGTAATVVVIVGFVIWAANTHSSEVSVFDGVTDAQLAQAGITVIDSDPVDSPSVSEYSIRRSVLQQAGIVIDDVRLVRIDLLKPGPTSVLGEHLAWAVRISPFGVANAEYYGIGFAANGGPEFIIMFSSATTGDFLTKYDGPPTKTFTPGPATPLPTNPP